MDNNRTGNKYDIAGAIIEIKGRISEVEWSFKTDQGEFGTILEETIIDGLTQGTMLLKQYYWVPFYDQQQGLISARGPFVDLQKAEQDAQLTSKTPGMKVGDVFKEASRRAAEAMAMTLYGA